MAIELGINFWDTADMYGNGENEKLISKVLVPNRDKVFIATKFGFRAIPGNPFYLADHQTICGQPLKKA